MGRDSRNSLYLDIDMDEIDSCEGIGDWRKSPSQTFTMVQTGEQNNKRFERAGLGLIMWLGIKIASKPHFTI